MTCLHLKISCAGGLRGSGNGCGWSQSTPRPSLCPGFPCKEPNVLLEKHSGRVNLLLPSPVCQSLPCPLPLLPADLTVPKHGFSRELLLSLGNHVLSSQTRSSVHVLTAPSVTLTLCHPLPLLSSWSPPLAAGCGEGHEVWPRVSASPPLSCDPGEASEPQVSVALSGLMALGRSSSIADVTLRRHRLP